MIVAYEDVNLGNDDSKVVEVATKFGASTSPVKCPSPETSNLYVGAVCPMPSHPDEVSTAKLLPLLSSHCCKLVVACPDPALTVKVVASEIL